MIRTWKVKGRGMFNGNRVLSSKYFIENNCVSCGWGQPGIDYPNVVIDFESYKKVWIEMYGPEYNWNFQGVHHLFESVKKGDFIWTRLDGEYYAAEILDSPKNLFRLDLSDEADSYDCSIQLKNIKWKKCGAEDTVPGSISTFSSNRNSIVRVDNKESFQNGYSGTSLFSKQVLYGDSVESINDRNMILRFIGPSGFEDIIALWLYDKYNYVVIPSTNKKSTQTYEFVLVNGNKTNEVYKSSKRIYIQAKNGKKDLKLIDYVELLEEGDEIWLITSLGTIFDLDNKIEDQKMVQYIKTNKTYSRNSFSIENLIDFIFDIRKKNLLPKATITWTQMFK